MPGCRKRDTNRGTRPATRDQVQPTAHRLGERPAEVETQSGARDLRVVSSPEWFEQSRLLRRWDSGPAVDDRDVNLLTVTFGGDFNE